MTFPGKYSNKTAIELGNLIGHAYNQFLSYEKGEKWIFPKEYELISVLTYSGKKTNVKEDKEVPIGFIAKKNRNFYIVFRGTETVKEWISNMNIRLEKYFIDGFGSVHEGFLASYKNIRKKLISEISKISRPKKIYITGHSLGGAFAVLSALDVAKVFNLKISTLYTFGAPRVGNNEFVKNFNTVFKNRSFRIVNTSDIITEIPFPTPIAGILGGYFSHIDTPVVFTEQFEDAEKNHHMKTYLNALNYFQNKDCVVLKRRLK